MNDQKKIDTGENDPYIRMRHIKITYSDNSTSETNINGTRKLINDYYIGSRFDVGQYPNEKMVKGMAVKFY